MRLVGLQRILSMQPDMFLLQRKSFFYIVEWYPDGNHCQREGCSMTEWEGIVILKTNLKINLETKN